MSAAVAAGLAVLLVLGALSATSVLLLAVLVLQGLLVAGWFPALQVPSRRGGLLVVAAAAVAADLAVLSADPTRPLAGTGPVLALALLAALAHQLVRRDGRAGLTGSLTATGSAAVLAVLAASWLALDADPDRAGLLVLAAVGLAAPAATDLGAARTGLPRWVAPVGAALVTLLAAAPVAGLSAVGLGAALVAAAGAAVAARLGSLLADRVGVPHPLLPAALPAALVAPAVYLLSRLLSG